MRLEVLDRYHVDRTKNSNWSYFKTGKAGKGKG